MYIHMPIYVYKHYVCICIIVYIYIYIWYNVGTTLGRTLRAAVRRAARPAPSRERRVPDSLRYNTV